MLKQLTRLMLNRASVWLVLALMLAACEGDAVIYAPTPLPPDVSPQVWAHPSGAFMVSVPRDWAVFAQNDAALSSASFSPAGAGAPALTVSVIRLNSAPSADGLAALAQEIQTVHRPHLRDYTPTDAALLPDGTWRFSGARQNPDGSQTALNTFISADGPLLWMAEVVIDPRAAWFEAVQRAVNTIVLNPAAPLPPTEPSTLGFVRTAVLEAQNTAAWTNATGVLFITGEVANASGQTLDRVPVRVSLIDANGGVILEAADATMGYALPAGGFAPFSLRFGQGQPPDAVGYRVTVGDGGLFPPPRTVVGAPALTWTDSSSFAADGALTVTGTVTHVSGPTVRDLLAVVTVFDSAGDVIGAWFSPLGIPALALGEAADYAVRVPELGAGARNYIIEIQGYADT